MGAVSLHTLVCTRPSSESLLLQFIVVAFHDSSGRCLDRVSLICICALRKTTVFAFSKMHHACLLNRNTCIIVDDGLFLVDQLYLFPVKLKDMFMLNRGT